MDRSLLPPAAPTGLVGTAPASSHPSIDAVDAAARPLACDSANGGPAPAPEHPGDAAGPQAALAPARASRTIPLPQHLTLAPIAPRVEDPAAKITDFDAVHGGGAGASPGRRDGAHPIGVIFKLALLAGVIFGSVYAVEHFVLTTRWQGDVKVFAEAVAARRGLSWRDAVEVEALPAEEYALELAGSVLGVTSTDAPTLASEWRAMGLAEGPFDLVAIGRTAMPDQPAFYEPGAGKIYELAGMSAELRGIALSRALTLALLDQHFGWGEVSSSTDPSMRLGVRALFDGDAVALQARTTRAALNDETQFAKVTEELGVLRFAAAERPAPPLAVALVGPGAEATMHLFHDGLTGATRNRAEQLPVTSDASVFDGVLGRAFTPVALATAGSMSVGMMHWYYALAGRIGSDAAWSAAVRWRGDATTRTQTPDSFCVTSTIATSDEAGRSSMLQAFDEWARLAPAESNTIVTAAGTDRIEVSACDPGPEADTIVFPEIRLFGNAPDELAVVGAMVAAGLVQTDEAKACVVGSLRSGQLVQVTEPTSIDRSLTVRAADVTSNEARILADTCGTS